MAAPVTGSNEIFHRRVRRSKRKRNSLRLVGHGRRVRRDTSSRKTLVAAMRHTSAVVECERFSTARMASS